MSIPTALLIAAFVCFLLSTFQERIHVGSGINLTALGMALWVLALLLGGA